MNRYFLLGVITFLSGSCQVWSQSLLSSQLAPSNKSIYKVIAPGATLPGTAASLPFSRIIVNDIRPDTTKLGFYRSTKDRHSYKYRFAGNTAETLAGFLSDQYLTNLDRASPNQLVIFIKKLWLSEFDSSELSLHNTHARNAWLYMKAEIYLQTPAAFHPVYRVDTVVYVRKQQGYTSGGFITNTLLSTLQPLYLTDFSLVARKKGLTNREVDDYNRSTAVHPDLLKPAKGVYASFSDLKNGTPAATDYEVRFESLTDMIYVKERDGSTCPRRNVWGFSDGETVFIRMGANFFPLYNHQNAWEFYGTAAMEFKATRMPVLGAATWPFLLAAAGATEISQYEKRLINLRAFQVDMENGKFY